MLPRTRPQSEQPFVKAPSKILLPIVIVSFVAICWGASWLQHKQVASEPSTGQHAPSDVAAGATFGKSGAGSTGSQSKGQWVSCHEDSARETDWCQVTDQSGTILYKGDFLPVGEVHRVPQARLLIGHFDSANGWVDGPNESLPVPVVPLLDGTLLVPADDSIDLKARWDRDPSERNRATPQS